MYFLYAALELLMAFYIGHTFVANTIVMNLAARVKIIAGLLSRAAGPPYPAVLPVSNPNRITVLRHADAAAIHLRIIVGTVGDDGEGEDSDGECGGELCRAMEAGVSRH